jgi:myosin-crossreactive antigen
VFSNTLLEDDYDYWLVFADSTKKWMSHFINDEQRKAYYRAYYIKKVQTLKEFGSLTSGNYNQYLLTLANVVYLLRSTTRQEITIDDSLQNDVF